MRGVAVLAIGVLIVWWADLQMSRPESGLCTVCGGHDDVILDGECTSCHIARVRVQLAAGRVF